MEEENKVSIWVGTLENREIFGNYIHENYDDEGNMSSNFMKDFHIEYYDSQFREALFDTSGKIEIFKNFSYAENFLKNFPFQDYTDFNSFILIYNFNHNREIDEVGSFKYIGTFNYQ